LKATEEKQCDLLRTFEAALVAQSIARFYVIVRRQPEMAHVFGAAFSNGVHLFTGNDRAFLQAQIGNVYAH